MKTFTKHILLLALMLFGVAGAAWASRAPQKFTGPVDIATLVEGDTLAQGFELTGNQYAYFYFKENRAKENGTLLTTGTGYMRYLIDGYGRKGAVNKGPDVYTPVLEDQTTNGNAWVVLGVQTSPQYIVTVAGAWVAPDPNVPELDELTGNWNFLMPGANKVVKVTYKAQPALAWTFGDRAIPNDTTLTAYRGFELPVIGGIGAIMDHDFLTALLGGTVSLRYGSTNPAVISFTDANDMRSFSVNGAGECNVYMVFDGNNDFQYDSVAFHAVIANPATLTLNPSAGGTLEIAGVTYDTTYNISFHHPNSPGDNRSITVSSLPYDYTFDYGSADVMDAIAYGPVGSNVSKFAQDAHTVTVRIGSAFEGTGYYSCIFEDDSPMDNWSFTCEASTVPVYPYGITKTGDNTYSVLPGTEVTLTTEPAEYYHLGHWANQAGTEVASVTPLTVTVTSDTTLMAVFERNMRILHGVPEGWTVMADSVAVAVSADSAVVPAGSQIMMIPPVPVKPTVKSTEVEKYLHPNEVPLTMEALTDGTIKVTEPKAGMRYAVNGGNKTDMSGTTQIDVTAGDKVAFYGNGTIIASYDGTKIAGGTAEVKVYGNIMSLVDEENFATAITLTGTRNFRQLFYENYKLKDASGLLLPATTLTERCYEQMFTYDTILTTAPALPATTMESNCYNNMFYGCTGLTTAPALPATTLAESCYTYMFYGCTSLTTAPALPATTLADYCYSYMFAGHTGLTTAPALPATTLADHCYSYMFANDTNLTTAPSILPATTLSQYCYQRMFHGCIRLTTAPKLPATTLANNCYNYMFYLCTSLTTAPELPATTLVPNCYAYMFQNCSNLRSVTCMATSGINSSNSTVKWLSNTAETGIFIANNAAEWPSGVNGIPEGWNVIDYASPMALNALTDGTIKVVSPKEGMQYSLNGGAKTVMNGNTEIQVTTGDKVAFYGNGTSINKYQGTIFAGTAQVKATGNIMSLVNEEHFDTATVLTGTQAFANLFMYDTNLVDASELLMPATTLTWGCYLAMFSDCSNLTGAPKLPATTLKPSAYGNMFSGCTSLTTVPDLPATTLADNCYANMFLGCTGLTTAPEIAATTLAVTCCAAMFQNCTSLTKAPSILPATTVASGCYRNMFKGCTSLTATPVLPVESVDKSCYERMFFGCSSLNTVTCLAKTSTGFFNTYEWLSGVAATGTFITPSTTEWDENVPSGIPAGWTRVDAE